jgi:hypothetical protein
MPKIATKEALTRAQKHAIQSVMADLRATLGRTPTPTDELRLEQIQAEWTIRTLMNNRVIAGRSSPTSSGTVYTCSMSRERHLRAELGLPVHLLSGQFSRKAPGTPLDAAVDTGRAIEELLA